MVNKERIKDEFIRLVKIESPSYKEKDLGDYLAAKLKNYGAEVTFDKAGEKIGGNCGNLLARIPATASGMPTLMFNAHMDTIKSRDGAGITFENGIFSSQDDKILGADDKSGIVAILEMLKVIKENKLPHGTIEIVLTVAEEVGLLGAKYLDYNWITAKTGFALDSGDCSKIINSAPAANRMKYKIYGLAAHAGVHPEDGISAIQIAAAAIAQMPLGRIDEETTANIGVIAGGEATNIIPDYVEITGEARSHSMSKLDAQTKKMSQAFRSAIEKYRKPNVTDLPRLEEEIRLEYSLMSVPVESDAMRLVQRAGKKLDRDYYLMRTGGGSDANIFNGRGIQTLILGTGMHNVHTSKEIVALNDMASCAELLVGLVSN